MKQKLFSLLAAIFVFSMTVLGWSPSTQAALCSKCRDMMFIDSESKCSDCGVSTASGALQICPKCSVKRHQCEHCLAAITEKDEAAAESKPADPVPENPQSTQEKPPLAWTAPTSPGNPARPDIAAAAKPTDLEINPLSSASAKTEKPIPRESLPESKPPAELPPDPRVAAKPKPIDPAKGGTYTSGKWRYQMQITSPGTRSEGRWGWLTYDGQKLPRGNVNDYYNTPWGPIYWVDVPTTAWSAHGWMPVPLAQNRRQGNVLAVPSSLLAAAPTPSGATTPATPRGQTLEINQSHNGQLARVRVGNVLVIRLPGNPAMGYQWQAATSTSPTVRMTVRPQYSPPASTATQAAALGTYTFTFQAVQTGTGSIRLQYVRPNDPGRPRDSFAVSVNVSPATTAATARPAIPVASRGE